MLRADVSVRVLIIVYMATCRYRCGVFHYPVRNGKPSEHGESKDEDVA